MPVPTKIAVLFVLLSFLWSLCYVILGNTASGKQWYGKVASKFFDDPKAGVPILTLCIPMLISGSVASLFSVKQPDKWEGDQRRSLHKRFPAWVHRLIQRWNAGSGDMNFNQLAFVFILIPLAVSTVANIHRHLYGNELSQDKKLKEVANSFGLASLIAFAFVLIPVARHSALLKLLDWNPAAAIRLHIWSGRIIFLGILIHGTLHIFRWKYIAGESLLAMLSAPRGCWTWEDTGYKPQCVGQRTECSCYHHFRNLTGFLGFASMLVIGGTSLNYVRRNHYRLFYLAHFMAAPIALVMVILHWNKSIVYIAPGLLYYTASAAPFFIETREKVKRDEGVRVVSVERLESARGRGQRNCVAITFEASEMAMEHFRPGHYIKLRAPEIAFNDHPFSVNNVPGKKNYLRVIFRATGQFTQALDNRLGLAKGRPPQLLVDGFYGPSHRVEQILKHDVAVLVAGGIGITPYLSALSKISSILADKNVLSTEATRPELVLHWICRDINLIQYVRTEYFEPLLCTNALKPSFRLRLIVHNTNSTSSGDRYSDVPEMVPAAFSKGPVVSEASVGVQFSPTRFSAGSRRGIAGNIPVFMTFSASAWLGLVSACYIFNSFVDKTHVASRAWIVVAIIAVALAVGVVANVCIYQCGPYSSLHMLGGLRWTSVDRDENQNAESRIEMEHIEDGHSLNADESYLSGEEDDAVKAVTYDDYNSRPSMHELLKQVHEARCPGLFVCGPSSLVRAIKEAAEERCLTRIRQCISGTPHIAIYEETFEI